MYRNCTVLIGTVRAGHVYTLLNIKIRKQNGRQGLTAPSLTEAAGDDATFFTDTNYWGEGGTTLLRKKNRFKP
jgi:hypothetical protein